MLCRWMRVINRAKFPGATFPQIHGRPLFEMPRRNTSEEEVGARASTNPYSLIKQDGIEVLSNVWIENFKHASRAKTDLTRFLKRFELWVLAYQKVYADETGELPARSSIHRHVLDDLLSLRNAVLQSNFKWGLNSGLYIRSPNDKFKARSKKPTTNENRFPFQDRIVQEVLFMILEPIFEPRFSQRSYAFRPGRNAHTVLRTIRSKFGGYLWFVKGDLRCVLDGLSSGVVMSCFARVVRDSKINGLIRSALLTPVAEEKVSTAPEKKKKAKFPKIKVFSDKEPKPDPYWLEIFYDFAPEEALKVPKWGHCGVLSSLLANICLNELDHWIEERISEFYHPSSTDVIWNSPLNSTSYNPSWPEFVPTSGREKTRKMDYIRYGGHILIGVRGSRGGAVYIRNRLIDFCREKYAIEIVKDGFPVEHITRGILFLDHIISRRVIYPTLRYTGSGGNIVSKKSVGTLLSVTVSLEQCIRKFRKLGLLKGDRDPDPQPCSRMFYATQAHCNMQMNKFLETMAEWYRYADNRKKAIRFCSYIIRGSLAKLYAAKYKLRSRAKVYKTASRDLSLPLREKDSKIPAYEDLLRMGLLDAIHGIKFSNNYLIPTTDYTPFQPDWVPDHEKVLQEYIQGLTPKTLKDQLNMLQKKGLTTPQDYLSKLTWSFKAFGRYRVGKPASEPDNKERNIEAVPEESENKNAESENKEK